MVSLGDTAISLHILQPPLMDRGGGVLESQNAKCQDMPKFQFSGGGCSGKSKPKCQDLPKFQLGGGDSGTKFKRILENLVKNFWKPSLLVHH